MRNILIKARIRNKEALFFKLTFLLKANFMQRTFAKDNSLIHLSTSKKWILALPGNQLPAGHEILLRGACILTGRV